MKIKKIDLGSISFELTPVLGLTKYVSWRLSIYGSSIPYLDAGSRPGLVGKRCVLCRTTDFRVVGVMSLTSAICRVLGHGILGVACVVSDCKRRLLDHVVTIVGGKQTEGHSREI